jgi:hypothetical protein
VDEHVTKIYCINIGSDKEGKNRGLEMNVEETSVMTISSQPFAMQIVKKLKQLENV